MQTLSVLAVEDGALVLGTPDGERFRLPVDAALRARLDAVVAPSAERRPSPREIQSLIRSGRSAEQVAAMTGVPVASIERFVGPVLAERAYVVESALAVRLPPETDGARSRTFGAVMGERLDALAASEVRWASAKEPSGWVLSVAFAADGVQHEARWRFDAKHVRLDADNVEASTLSQQGVPAALTPRLRAIEPTAPVTIVPQPQPAAKAAERPVARVAPAPSDRARFDSAAFEMPPDLARPRPAAPSPDELTAMARRRGRREPAPDGLPETAAIDVVRTDGEVFAPRPDGVRASDPGQAGSVTPFPMRPRDDVPVEDRPTEPLRRRRDRGRTGGALRPAEPQQRPEPQADTAPPEAEQPSAPAPSRPRRGRTSMPSWDEIVFGRDD